MGACLPHEGRCNADYYQPNGEFMGAGMVIQFLPEFLGDQFFDLPENQCLKRCLQKAALGCRFYGRTKRKLLTQMQQMRDMDGTESLNNLLAVLKILAKKTNTMCFPEKLLEISNMSNSNRRFRQIRGCTPREYKKHILREESLQLESI